MNKIKRYDMETRIFGKFDAVVEPVESETGGWIRFEEVEHMLRLIEYVQYIFSDDMHYIPDEYSYILEASAALD